MNLSAITIISAIDLPKTWVIEQDKKYISVVLLNKYDASTEKNNLKTIITALFKEMLNHINKKEKTIKTAEIFIIPINSFNLTLMYIKLKASIINGIKNKNKLSFIKSEAENDIRKISLTKEFTLLINIIYHLLT